MIGGNRAVFVVACGYYGHLLSLLAMVACQVCDGSGQGCQVVTN